MKVNYEFTDESNFRYPELDDYMNAKLCDILAKREREVRDSARPLIAKGYRVEELEQQLITREYDAPDGDIWKFLGVHVKKYVSPVRLFARRQWRKKVPYKYSIY